MVATRKQGLGHNKMWSFLLWFGGKTRMLKNIIATLDENEWAQLRNIVVPMMGGGAVLYCLAEMCPLAKCWGSDIIPELVQYHQALIGSPIELHATIMRERSVPIRCSVDFAALKKAIAADPAPSMSKCAAFWSVSRNSYCGNLRNYCKKGAMGLGGAAPLPDIREMPLTTYATNCIASLTDVFDVLDSTADEPHTLLFLDPPYWLTQNYYGLHTQQGAFDHDRLFRKISELRHSRWILTYNDVPDVRHLYRAFFIRQAHEGKQYQKITVGPGSVGRWKIGHPCRGVSNPEIIITNFPRRLTN
jgi:site-specific DNA-adenine methylase